MSAVGFYVNFIRDELVLLDWYVKKMDIRDHQGKLLSRAKAVECMVKCFVTDEVVPLKRALEENLDEKRKSV